MRILLAPDKFKQTLTQEQAAAAMAEGVVRSLSGAVVRSLPMADGGEGTLLVLVPDRREHLAIPVTGPMGEITSATCARTPDGTGYVEMALCSGLGLVSPHRRDAIRASSRGTGEAMVRLLQDCREVRVGVGGSASTDGGTGAARAAGLRFLDRSGREVPEGGGHLADVASIDVPERPTISVTALCDVMVPLAGSEGAAMRFASQKGASRGDVMRLEAGLFNLAEVIERELGVDLSELPGAGAGGGMGAGLHAFFGASLVSGAASIADQIGLDEAITDADLVITGEGRLDRGTFGNKVVAEVARRAVRFGVPVMAVCGQIDRTVDLTQLGLREAISVEDQPARAEDGDGPAARLAATVAATLANL